MSENEDKGFGALLLEAGIVVLYLSAVAFVAGWSYADTYFAELGLNLAAIDGLGTESFYGYAFWVAHDPWLIALVVGLSVAMILVGTVQPLQALVPAVWRNAVLVALAAGSLFLAGYFGTLRATSQMEVLFTEHYQTFPRIKVIAKEGSALEKFLATRDDLGANSCLRNLLMDQSHLYAYAGYASFAAPRPPVFIFDLDDIAVVETVANQSLC